MNTWTILSFGVPEEIANRLVDGRASHPGSRRRRTQHVDRSILRDTSLHSASWRDELRATLDWGVRQRILSADRLAVIIPREVDQQIVDEVCAFLQGGRKNRSIRLIRPSEARIERLLKQMAELRKLKELKQATRPQLALAG